MSDKLDVFMLLALRDNILHAFFQILWEKSRSRRTLTNVRIPDTVIFSHSRVADWYFTSRDGIIRKKGHSKLSSANVLEQFEKRAKKNKSNVVAVLLERDPTKEEGLRTRHMDLAAVRQFLGEGGGSGTLQSFVEPKSESGAVHNNEIVLNWTPNVFYVEKKTNLCDIAKESKASLDERTTVEETAKNVNVAPLVSSRVTAELEAICQEVALHLEVVSSPSVRLASMGLHVKLDAHDQLFVMFCSSIRLMSVEPPSRVVSVNLLTGRTEKAVAPSEPSNSKASMGAGKHSNNALLGRSAMPPNVSQTSKASGLHVEELLGVRQATSGDTFDTASSSDGESLCHSENQRSRSGSKPNLRGSSHSPDGRPRETDVAPQCAVCINDISGGARVVSKRHILFPLSVIAFFSSHPPGSRYVDVVASNKEPTAIPEFVRLLHPEITMEEYVRVRRDPDWIAEPMNLCDQCADGLRDIVASLQLEKDGSILVPRPQRTSALPASSRNQSSNASSNTQRVVDRPPLAQRSQDSHAVEVKRRSSSSAS